ncbi:hypothetical protein [Streptomyces sp. JV178]|uniref:hypothetical protein n=1 Tax=Streptomyces sp. JV178 TaxID=858632 RepID=UPI0034D4E6A9
MLGLYTSVAPSFLSRLLGLSAPALAGAVVSTVCAASALGQITLVRPLGRTALPVACALLVVGMGLLTAGLTPGSPTLLVVAGAVAGLGQGVAFRVAMACSTQTRPTVSVPRSPPLSLWPPTSRACGQPGSASVWPWPCWPRVPWSPCEDKAAAGKEELPHADVEPPPTGDVMSEA